MFFKPSNFTFLTIMILSTIMVISSSSWMNAWMALEINLMSIIPILVSEGNKNSSSSSIKYFVTQAMASMFLIMIVLLFYNMSAINMLNVNNEIILISLVMKSGIPPFHFWLPQVIETSEIYQTFILLSWQKIAPFVMMSYCLCNMIMMVILFGAMVGSVGGVNQNSMKKILAYSSMAHGAWMMFSMVIKQNLWMIYFVIYNMSLIIVCVLMEKLSIEKISDINSSKIVKNASLLFMTSVMSMAGLPPFLGFFGKLVVISELVFSAKMLMSVSVLFLASLISLSFYLKMSYSAYLMNESKMLMKKNTMKGSSVLIMIMVLVVAGPTLVYLT